MNISYWMILPDMVTKAVDPGECLFTELAGEILFKDFFLLQVSPAVFLQVLLLSKYFAADLALVLLAGRCFLVSPVALGGHPVPPTPLALESVLHTVLQMHVAFQASGGGEGVSTQFTMFQSRLGMLYGLVILTGLLRSKRLLTVGAHKRRFARVYSHMIH